MSQPPTRLKTSSVHYKTMPGLFTSTRPSDLDTEANRLQRFEDDLNADEDEYTAKVEALKDSEARLRSTVNAVHAVATTIIQEGGVADDVKRLAEQINEEPDDTIPRAFYTLTDTVASHLDTIEGVADHHVDYAESVDSVRETINDAAIELEGLVDDERDDIINDIINDDKPVPAELKPLLEVYEEHERSVEDALNDLLHDKPRLTANTPDELTDGLAHHAQKVRDHANGLKHADDEDKRRHDTTKLTEHVEHAQRLVADHLSALLNVSPSSEALDAYNADVTATYAETKHLRSTREHVIQQLRSEQAKLREQADTLTGLIDDLDHHRSKFYNATRRIKDLLATELTIDNQADENGFIPRSTVPDSLDDDVNDLQRQQREAITSYTKLLSRKDAIITDDYLSLFNLDVARQHLDDATTETMFNGHDDERVRQDFHDAYYVVLTDEDDVHRQRAPYDVTAGMDAVIEHLRDAVEAIQ